MNPDTGVGAALNRILAPAPQQSPVGTLSAGAPPNQSTEWMKGLPGYGDEHKREINVALPSRWFYQQAGFDQNQFDENYYASLDRIQRLPEGTEPAPAWMQDIPAYEATEEVKEPELPAGWQRDDVGNLVSPEGWRFNAEGYATTPGGLVLTPDDQDKMRKALAKYAVTPEAGAEMAAFQGGMVDGQIVGNAVQGYYVARMLDEKALDRSQVAALFGEDVVTDAENQLTAYRSQQNIAKYQKGQLAGEVSVRAATDKDKKSKTLWAPGYNPLKLGQKESPANPLTQAWQSIPGSKALDFVGNSLNQIASNVGALQRRYADNPWDMNSLWWTLSIAQKTGTKLSDSDKAYLETFDRITKEKGPVARFLSPDLYEAYLNWAEANPDARLKVPEQVPLLGGQEVIRLMNPLYIMPVSGVAGLGAKIFARVPILGDTAKMAVSGIRAAERLAAAPIEMPLKATGEALGALGEKVGQSYVRRAEKMLASYKSVLGEDLPKSEAILDDMLRDNWHKRAVRTLAKTPGVGPKIVETVARGLGGIPEVIGREAVDFKSIAGRGALLKVTFDSMGRNAAAVQKYVLRDLVADPMTSFQMSKKQAVSSLKRVSDQATGTLEDIMIHPDYYELTPSQRQYVKAVNNIQDSMFYMMRKEGVNINDLGDEYFHRVVTGYVDENNKVWDARSRTKIDAHQKYETQAGGIIDGIRYNPNPEVAVQEYVEMAFRKIGEKRVKDYFAPLGKIPEEMVQSREAQKVVAGDWRKFGQVINRVMRGEKPASKTIEALEQSTVDKKMVERLKAAVGEASVADQEIYKYLSRVENILANFEKTSVANLEKALLNLDNRMLAETFKMYSPADRAAVRDVLGDHLASMQKLGKGAEGAKLAALQGRQAEMSRILKVIGDVDADLKAAATTTYTTDVMGYPEWANGPVKVGEALSEKDFDALVQLYAEVGQPPPNIVMTEGPNPKVFRVDTELPKRADIKARRAELRSLRSEARYERMGEVVKLSSISKKISEIRNSNLKNGQIFTVRSLSGQIFDDRFIREVNKFFGHETANKGLRAVADISAIQRLMKASLDFSVMAIQGMPAFGLAATNLAANPVQGTKMMGQWMKAFGYSVGSFFDTDMASRYIAKNRASITSRVRAGGSMRVVDMMPNFETKGVGEFVYDKVLGNIPLKPYKRAEMSFFMGGEVLRDEFWKIMSPKAMAKGQEKELARFLDRMTGIFDSRKAGISLSQREIENAVVFFAPQYTRACLSMVASMFQGGMTGAEARKALGGMIAGGAAFYAGAQYASSTLAGKTPDEAWKDVLLGFGVREDPVTGEVTWKPGSEFMTMKVGNYRFGPGGFWYGMTRLAGDVSGTIREDGLKTRWDLVKPVKDGRLNRDNPFLSWWYNRSAPFVGTVNEAMVNRADYLGYPLETDEQYLAYFGREMLPMWAEQALLPVMGYARENELPEGYARQALIPLQMFGMRSAAPSMWVKFYDQANLRLSNLSPDSFTDDRMRQAWKEGRLTWAQLNDKQRQDMLEMYPDILKAYEEAQKVSLATKSAAVKQYNEAVDSSRQTAYDQVAAAANMLRAGTMTMKDYRDACSEAMSKHAQNMSMFGTVPMYQEVQNVLAKLEKEQNERYMDRFNLAYDDFLATVALADFTDAAGVMQWDKREEAMKAYKERWGEQTYFDVQQLRLKKKDDNGLDPLWQKKTMDSELLTDYWRLPESTIASMSHADYSAGKIPPEYVDQWLAYQKALETAATYGDASVAATKKAWQQGNPDLFRDLRAEYRASHPEQDAALAFWGYGGEMESAAAYDLAVQWADEHQVPLNQTKASKFPSSDIAKQYFEYYALEKETDQILYKRQHPEFNHWAMEHLGHVDANQRKLEGPTDTKLMQLYQQFKELSTETERWNFRNQHDDLNAYLVYQKGFDPLPAGGPKLKLSSKK